MCIDQILTIINLVILSTVPFGAVWLAFSLQKRYDRQRDDLQKKYNIRHDKLDIFKVLMANRDNKTPQNWAAQALALNVIPVIFSTNQEVLKQNKALMKVLKSSADPSLRESTFLDLARLIAEDLGYKEHLNDVDLLFCIHASDFDYIHR